MTFPESKALSPHFGRGLGWGRRDLGSSFYHEAGGALSEMVDWILVAWRLGSKGGHRSPWR